MLALHILGGVLVLLFATVALLAKKGGKFHRFGGNIFFVSMVLVSTSAIYLDIASGDTPAISVLALYLVVTSWVTIKRKEGTIGLFEKLAFVAITAVAIGLYSVGWHISSADGVTKNGVPAAMYFVFGTLALFAAALDLIMIVKGGVTGKHRIARHLWRMCIPVVMATMSVLSQKSVIPVALQGKPILWLPILLLLSLMFFWLIKVLFTKWHQSRQPAKVEAT
ncbi:DUF2306 domain-containing protein [Flocculibacter collagenilyticus]|uniref:hypothetical protein n=1 Tax=Flocculibacter collagenilyticus TaxID=2744479 RepID=UPI0018F5B0A9|nr:hypothetical protein [Flocculibacter collagenilyticus]